MIDSIVALGFLLAAVVAMATLLVSRAGSPKARMHETPGAGPGAGPGDVIAVTSADEPAESSELHVNGGWR